MKMKHLALLSALIMICAYGCSNKQSSTEASHGGVEMTKQAVVTIEHCGG